MTAALATMRVDYNQPTLKDMKKVKNSLKERREKKGRKESATAMLAAEAFAATAAVMGPAKK